MDIAVLGIDLGKNSCSVVGLDSSGKVVLRRRMQRKTIVTVTVKLSPCIIAMEACCGAHHLGRLLAAQGHTVRLMSPEYVRPYVKAQKNDDRDAEAIAEAATRPTMRFVALKSEEQLDMQSLHRARDRVVGERTSLMNQLRALLLERGIVVPQGRAKLKYRVTELLVQPCDDLSPRIRILIEDMLPRWQALDDRIAAFDTEFAAEVKQNEAARRLTSIPGIGALNATALVAAVGDARTFARGRDLAAWLGLVPRQATTGGKPRLLGITKRGSKYLRKMLIQGARAALPTLSRGNTLLGQWLRGLLARAHSNTVVVALAANGLTVDRCSANLWRKMAPGCRPLYEDRNARISILANGIAERPDTFVQTVHASIAKPLADGAGHTFAPAAERCAFTCELSRLSS